MDASGDMRKSSQLAARWTWHIWMVARMAFLGYVLADGTAVAAERDVPLLWRSTSGEDALKEKRQDCGIECLYVFARLKGQPCDLEAIRERVPLTEQGASARDMQRAAHDMGLALECVRCAPDRIEKLALPAIAHIQRRGVPDSSHYVVLTDVTADSVFFVDPTINSRHEIPRSEWARASSGYYLTPPTPAFDTTTTALWLGAGCLFLILWLWVRWQSH